LGTAVDITERKRAEAEVRAAETRFRAFVEHLADGLFIHDDQDEDGRVIDVNQHACKSLGYTREELIGTTAFDYDAHVDATFMRSIKERLARAEIVSFESVHRRKDGTTFPVEIRCRSFWHGDHRFGLALVRDISERKRAEEATLEARVSERTRIARDLHDTLLQSFHGLLLQFQSVSQLLPERPAVAKERLDSAITQAAEAIAESRNAVQGLRESTVQRNDLGRAIGTLGEELAKERMNHSPVGFHLSVEGEPRNLHPIVRDEIYKISAEAMRNAFRHADAKQVAVEVHYEEEQVRLRVRDDGKGIDPEVLSRKASEGHYGIAGMRERATIIGGNLELRSQLGRGTTIELCVPASKAYAGQAERIPSFKSVAST
jgi:PAS domain S-box-containing protein